MLTKRTLESLTAHEARYEHGEHGGLRVRIYPSGRKSLLWRYRDPGGAQRVLVFGEWPAISLAEARRRLAEAKALREQGTDPADQKAEKRAKRRDRFRERRAAPAVADILDEYMTRHVLAVSKPTTQAEFRRLIERELKPRLGQLKAAEVKRSGIVAILDDIADTATASIADHAGNVLRSAFRFAVARGRLEHTPCQALPRYAAQTSRECTLTPDEIRALWAALEAHKGVSEPVALALKLLLLTAQRRKSLAGAKWSEFSAERWEIPAENMKSGKAHVVPLSPLAQELVARLRELTGACEWVLPNPRLSGPVTERALTRALARLRTADYTVHDLRRTAATLMTQAGVSSFIVGRVLAHAYRSETGKYDRYEYRPEKRRALETLARKLGEIIGRPDTATVVVLR
jgi:integrase